MNILETWIRYFFKIIPYWKNMVLVAPIDNNRWIYTMHGLEKPMDHVSAGGVMAGSVATLAVLWISLQTLGFLGHSSSIELPPIDNRHEIIIDTRDFNNIRLPKVDEKTLNASINFGKTIFSRINRLEGNINSAGIGLVAGTPAHNEYINSYSSDDALEKSIDAQIAIKASAYLSNSQCQRFGLNDEDCARFVSTLKLDGTQLGQVCQKADNIKCNKKSKYRSIDGTCNNLENPKWGSAMTAYSRVLFPQYSDGIQEPRRAEQGGKSLPSARVVSASLSTPSEQTDLSNTLAVMQWGQFISHDISHTPVRRMFSMGKPISCCNADGFMLSPRYVHPDCDPITVPDHDPVYGKHLVRCMNYVRSLPVLRQECTLGPIEQMNQVSHFLDGSTIYGSTLRKSRELRTFEKGKLRFEERNNRQFLPTATDELSTTCRNDICYSSGDHRVNVEPQLAVMHTIWHREHNRIAEKLSLINPHWSDELLYQEARRIVIAEIQHIAYKEWLPIVLGKKFMRSARLFSGTGYSLNYNAYEDPSVSNEAATAALQFVASLKQGNLSVPDNTRQINNSLQLSDYFYKPRAIEADDNFDGLIRGLATQGSQKMDFNFVADVSNKLYKTNGEVGLDKISLDIQRGRDHGIPGYNYYRTQCGLETAKTFDDFLDYIPLEMVRKLRTIYTHPNDIDLLVGGMAERHTEDGMLGPTFRCLLADQFSRSRRTDRFFYDSILQPYPFTPEQLGEIRNVTLARVFCDNSDNIERMQANVFQKPQFGNELRSCNDFEAIPSVDLFAWAEKAKAYR